MFAAKPDRVDLSVVLEDDDLWAQNSSSASTSRSRTRGAAGPRPVELVGAWVRNRGVGGVYKIGRHCVDRFF